MSATATAVLQPESRTLPFTETASINTSGSSVGIADSDLYKMAPDDVNRTLDAVKATGVNSVRLMMPWAGMEPQPGQFDWGQVDVMVDAANARGMSVLGTLVSSPSWATDPGLIPISSPPASAAAYADFAGAVAARYRGRVAAYEIWNEPNGVLSWTSGPQGPEPARYVELLKASYPKIKAADGSAIVVGGALGAVISFGAISVDPVLFLNQMYAAGAKGSFDALSFHPYQYTTMFSQGGGLGNSPINQLGAMRQTMSANGDGGKKIWATEYGEPTSAVDEATQAAYLTDFLSTWRTLSYAGPAYIYTTRDRATGGGTEDTFGIYRTDWTPKPAQAAVAALA
ncbi:cellulase family glycosylhydrolase [Mycolicibacterium sp.]|uniref:cellulase family glycosylhydrolase n=1 Tax=Mycolicibacterium sp. TaxID=2320850 RepID=UPI001A23B1E6|nr:cellulase family glycosylhydrolase [Mycolicibacterium sp.]MBJ7339793.1 cellulase family glycosylhydrolase [Mycolicibacterium sp.]